MDNTDALIRQSQELKNITDQIDQSWKEMNQRRVDLEKQVLALSRSAHQERLHNYREQMALIDRYAKQSVDNEALAQQARAEVPRRTSDQIAEQWLGHVTGMADLTRTVFESSLGGLSHGISNELVDGTHDWEQSMKRVLKLIIQMVLKMIVMQTIARSIGASLSGGFGFFGGLFHQGGRVMHHGGPVPRHHTGDSIRTREVPAILERGEYVVNRRAVARPGALRQLSAMNAGAAAQGRTVIHETHNQFSVSISAIDAENMEAAVNSRIIPLLQEAQRRGAYSPSDS